MKLNKCICGKLPIIRDFSDVGICKIMLVCGCYECDINAEVSTDEPITFADAKNILILKWNDMISDMSKFNVDGLIVNNLILERYYGEK